MRSLNNNSFIGDNLTIGPAGYECYDRPVTSSGVTQAQAIRVGPARPLSAPEPSRPSRSNLGTSVGATPRAKPAHVAGKAPPADNLVA